jgi:hypothetical protein
MGRGGKDVPGAEWTGVAWRARSYETRTTISHSIVSFRKPHWPNAFTAHFRRSHAIHRERMESEGAV